MAGYSYYMKYYTLIILIFASRLCWAQFTDDFSDGDFTQNPQWTGDTGLFIVNNQNQLQLNDNITNEAYLTTRSRAILDAEWEFYVKMDFNPSGSNFCRVYLISDSPDLLQNLNGYFVRVGGFSGNVDHVSLYKQTGNSSTQIIKGTDGTVTTAPELKVRVTRDNAGEWELEIDTGMAGNYISQGTATDDEHMTAEFFGVRCTYTSTRATLFYFDDFNVTGTVIPDTIPPGLDSAVALSATSVALYFNEEVDPATAGNAQNYSVDNGVGAPAAANVSGTEPGRVNLLFTPALQSELRYTVTVNDVEDLAGNPARDEKADFVFFTPQIPDPGDVIINEIMADERPVVGLPEAEYVELYNVSNKAFELRNWEFHDNSNSSPLPRYALLPGEYVVLVDERNLSLFDFIPNVIGVPSMPILRNSDDDISIWSAQNERIDRVVYTYAWYRDSQKAGGGYSLELINPNDPCSNANNWIASNDPLGGTPGTQNSVYDTTPDTGVPFAEQFEVLTETELKIIFNKTLDSSSVITGNFNVNQGVNVANVSLSGTYDNEVTAFFQNPIDSAEIFELSASNISDCWGNTTTIEITFALGVEPKAFEIIFNEVHHNPDDELGSLPNEKFTEFYNTTDKPLRLGDLTYADRTSSRTFPNTVIFPEEYLIVTTTAFKQDYEAFGRVIAFSGGPSPNLNDDDLTLTNAGGTVIDQLSYRRQWHTSEAFGGGFSLERKNPVDFCEGRNNWTSSSREIGGTPGEQNSVFDPDLQVEPPRISGVIVEELNRLKVTFNRRMDLASLITADYLFLPALDVVNIDVNQDKPLEVILTLNDDLQPETVYELRINGAFDCAGAALEGDRADRQFTLPQPGDLVINEVLFNPRTGGSRFIEFYNPKDYSVSLSGWRFDYDNTAGNPASELITGDYTVEPGSYLALTPDIENIVEEYPEAAVENLRTQAMPRMTNSNGRVIIVSTLSDTIDDFSYSADFHFSILRDLSGVSLERISHERPTNEESNWHSASQTVNFATPGYTNSQRADLETQEDEITLSPETFSPDNDGYNDVLNIGYELSAPGYVANIKIYDQNGRLIKNLARNELLGRRGALTWDGVNENGEKASIGIHVVYIELFDLEGNVKHFKKACVVAGKL